MAFARLQIPGSIPGTQKLFHDDPYLKEADATVLYVDGAFVILDRTIFYAESGGQEWDEGEISGIRVIDTQDQGGQLIYVNHPRVHVPAVKVDTIVVHRLSEPASFQVGDRVDLKLDWDRRYANMRQHSASHFVYHAVHQIYGPSNEALITKGCHIRPDGHRFDFGGDLPGDRIPEVQEMANALIAQRLEIGLEPEPMSGEIKYWTYDRDIIIPCGGTHVRSAQELQPLTVGRSKKGKNVTRISGKFV